jgi:tetratricopeptide (TPR) repeat protein
LSDGKAAAARRVLAMAEQDFPGDPAPGAAVRVLLAKGEGPAELALAAAALACYSELAGPSLDRVAHALKASHELGTRRVLTRALAAGLELGERWEQLYALAGEAAGPEQPDSAFSAQARALEHLGRTTALRALAEERLKRHPRDPLAQRALATAASLAGEHAEALRLTRSALPERAAAADYERAAWMGLLVEPPDGTALDHARRAVSLDGKKRGSPGRILAALLAASGEPGTAVKELVEGESVYTPPEDPADWLTMGKAAETYGLVEEARALYRRAAMASGGDRLVKTLAERWGARLPP